MFGFYDYDKFIGNNLGLGSATFLGPTVFWFCIILGVVVAQNVMLAIVSQAYDNIQQKGNTLTTRMPLWTQSKHRLIFACRRRCITSRKKTNTGDESALRKAKQDWFDKLESLPKWERQW